LRRNHDRNSFVYMHVLNPHGPYDPPAPFDHWFREEGPGETRVDRGDGKLDPDWVQRPTAEGRRMLYDGEVLHNDVLLERFLERLKEFGSLEDTLLVFMSDHGEALGAHGRHGHGAPGFRQVLHVPLLMIHRKAIPAGRIVAPVQLIDVAPTILELAGVDAEPLLLQGESLVSLMRGERIGYWQDRISLSEEVSFYLDRDDPRVSGSVFFRGLHVLGSLQFDEPHLYDYVVDPAEVARVDGWLSNILWGWHAKAVMRDVKESNLEIWRSMHANSEGVVLQDPSAWEQLRELGYVE
jgi:hypothetical protein